MSHATLTRGTGTPGQVVDPGHSDTSRSQTRHASGVSIEHARWNRQDLRTRQASRADLVKTGVGSPPDRRGAQEYRHRPEPGRRRRRRVDNPLLPRSLATESRCQDDTKVRDECQRVRATGDSTVEVEERQDPNHGILLVISPGLDLAEPWHAPRTRGTSERTDPFPKGQTRCEAGTQSRRVRTTDGRATEGRERRQLPGIDGLPQGGRRPWRAGAWRGSCGGWRSGRCW